jgi:hypothetical protein
MLIDGQLTDLVYDAPLDAPIKVTGPTQIAVTVPRGVQADLVLAGPGFGRGERVSFENSEPLEVSANDANHGEDGGNRAKERKKAKKGKKAKKRKTKSSRTIKQEAFANESSESVESQATRAKVHVEIAVLVPAVENFPVGVDFAPRLLRLLNPIRVEGTANTWIRLTAKV